MRKRSSDHVPNSTDVIRAAIDELKAKRLPSLSTISLVPGWRCHLVGPNYVLLMNGRLSPYGEITEDALIVILARDWTDKALDYLGEAA